DEGQATLSVHPTDVTGVEPAVRIDRLGGAFLVPEVAAEEVGAPEEQLPGLTGRKVLAGVRVDDPALHAGQRLAAGLQPRLERFVEFTQRNERRGLRHRDTVD